MLLRLTDFVVHFASVLALVDKPYFLDKETLTNTLVVSGDAVFWTIVDVFAVLEPIGMG